LENFTAYNPVKIHFGKNCIEKLSEEIEKIGKKVLVLYGAGSIKKNGLYKEIISKLNTINLIEVQEFSGIKANPITEDVDKAAEQIRKSPVDCILAVGGGSVIDSAKMLSIAACGENPVWDFYEKKAIPKKSIPVLAVLTLAATGTEMNPYAVLQNNKNKSKQGYGNPLLYPVVSFLDPKYTLSVPLNYTAYGVVDLVAHSLEHYFSPYKAQLTDKFIVAIIKEAMDFGTKIVSDLQNYDLRERMMWAATNALNGTTGYGKKSGDWGVHGIEHSLSVLFNVAHGAGLSIVYPAWMKAMKEEIRPILVQLCIDLFHTDDVDICILQIEKFFQRLGSPIRLQEIGVERAESSKILENLILNKVTGMHVSLEEKDYISIINHMFSVS
jgi:alcohol dehydrogenase YqhD (iron-dependent ADH family)